MVSIRKWLPLLAAVMAATGARAQNINWQDAVARLKWERTEAEACASVLKKYGDATAVARGSLAYASAKAEYDAIITGLSIALARKEQPNSLPDLQERLERGFEERQAFCKSADALIPQSQGEKGVVDEIVSGAVSGAVGPLIQALLAIYMRRQDNDALTRKTIETQLEAASWPAFASVAPSS